MGRCPSISLRLLCLWILAPAGLLSSTLVGCGDGVDELSPIGVAG